MGWRNCLLLAALGLAVAVVVAENQDFPGYLDSDYYLAGGIQIAAGRGFTEPYLWNYLDDPQGLPHPSHAYWMPLASLISAGGMWLTGRLDFAAGRLGFIALAALTPVLVGALGYAFSARRELALTSGFLAVFSGYYLPFMPIPDNYGVYIALGASFFLLLSSSRGYLTFGLLGVIAGLMSLARSDGILWLSLAGVAVLWPMQTAEEAQDGGAHHRPAKLHRQALQAVLVVLGFLAIMLPWYLHSWEVHGTLMAPGGNRLLWLTTYDDTFIFPGQTLTFRRWIAQGLPSIISARVAALRWNLLNAFAAQGAVFLAPFILYGIWVRRDDRRVQLGLLGWFAILVVMTVFFPFAGSRGGFFHAGAGMQGLWWALAPIGLDALISAARQRGMFTPAAPRVFGWGMVGVAAAMSMAVLAIRVFPGWGEGEQRYPAVERLLVRAGADADQVVMVRNPPGYYIMTGRPAIVIPYAGAEGILAAAYRFDARYLVIEPAGAAGPIRSVYDDLSGGNFEFVGDVDGIHIFSIPR